ncbi:MAG: 2-oxo acid dehydrogenase subunit E2 [Candidatus Bathyarchaeota archaeon]|nr:MAG: 2-oxo acid dehydrogenase subunit E2 [Candidatus Bathyarchaeota archaeon]
MVTKVMMPRLSLTMKEGTVVQWFKKEGESVEKGEPVVEVLSDKVTFEVEAPASGVVRKILAEEGTDVPVAETLAIITAPEEELPDAKAVAKVPVEKVEKRIIASPAAKRLAREYGLDLAQVEGTGPEGRIVEEDVTRFINETTVTPKVKEVIVLTGIRKTAAERISLSARRAPHSTITMEVDMSNATKLRKESQLSYTDLLVKAVASALEEHPIMNSTLEEDQIKIFEDVNVGVAVATEKGLIVPVIRNADKKDPKEISLALKELVEKARAGKLTQEEMSGGTFTITNLGMFGVDIFTPIINPPETAILGVGRVTKKPAVVDREIVAKPVMKMSLSFDHRVVDGVPAAQFLQKIKQTLESATSPW